MFARSFIVIVTATSTALSMLSIFQFRHFRSHAACIDFNIHTAYTQSTYIVWYCSFHNDQTVPAKSNRKFVLSVRIYRANNNSCRTIKPATWYGCFRTVSMNASCKQINRTIFSTHISVHRLYKIRITESADANDTIYTPMSLPFTPHISLRVLYIYVSIYR